MTYWGVEILLETAEGSRCFDFRMLCSRALGDYGSFIFDCVVVLGGLGSMLSYVFVMGSLTTNIVAHFYTFKSQTEINELKVIATIITFIAVTPLCLIRNFGHLAGISWLSAAAAVGGTVLLVLLGGLLSLFRSSNTTSALLLSSSTASLNYLSLSGMLRTLGSVVFAFSFSPALFPALLSAEGEVLTPATSRAALRTAVSVGCLGCLLIGLAGYLSFGPATQSDILLNYSLSPAGLAMQAGRVRAASGAGAARGPAGAKALAMPAAARGRRAARIQIRPHTDHGGAAGSAGGGVRPAAGGGGYEGGALAAVLQVSGGLSQALLSFLLPAAIALRLPEGAEELHRARLLLLLGVLVPLTVVVQAVLPTR
eukprot:CAMPEP_0170102624 /NCGR_PEP_ID=MMETSP0020_2-20130122/2995_1 /TAXON_ID=98059 /ORGANISM="Dinobryon sp., Strain UTEXLB2267" /LENGTH=368 /DNA_ID=CAMNT_0010326007 /DNA_START=225 /DNA_END=1332 /DNA_ORIENTATION=-